MTQITAFMSSDCYGTEDFQWYIYLFINCFCKDFHKDKILGQKGYYYSSKMPQSFPPVVGQHMRGFIGGIYHHFALQEL